MKKNGILFWKKGSQNFYPCPYSIPILSVLHENKALHNFRQGGQHLIVEFNVGLEYALFVVSGKLAVNGLTSSWYIAHPEFLQNFNYPRLALLTKKFYTFFRTASWSWSSISVGFGQRDNSPTFLLHVCKRDIFDAVFFAFASNSSMIVSKICECQGNDLTVNAPSFSSSSKGMYTRHKHLSILAFLASSSFQFLKKCLFIAQT